MSQEEQADNGISYRRKRSILRAFSMTRTHRDDYHLLPREQEAVLIRLCTSHNSHDSLNNRIVSEAELVLSEPALVVKKTKA